MSWDLRIAAFLFVCAAAVGCASPQSMWLKSANPATAAAPATTTTAPAAPAASTAPLASGDRTCWDGCRGKFRDDTIELSGCIQRCPEAEKRPVGCPKDAGAQCVNVQDGGPLLLVLLGAVVAGLAIGVAVALAL